jgi:hypothetical protein
VIAPSYINDDSGPHSSRWESNYITRSIGARKSSLVSNGGILPKPVTSGLLAICPGSATVDKSHLPFSGYPVRFRCPLPITACPMELPQRPRRMPAAKML